MCRKLLHKHIVLLYGVLEHEGEQYIVTEFLNKGSLRDFLLNESNLLSQQDLISL